MQEMNNTIETVDADEVKLAEIRKHPLGIILLYLQAGIGMALAIGLAYFLLPTVLDNTDQALFIGNVFAMVAVVLAAIVVIIATFIYRQNGIVITDRNITQSLQYGLFSRKVSQLNMHNVEDVTAVQDGFMPTFFNYGTLKVETAGEQVNFVFPFCPNPGYYAKIILNCREKVLGQMASDPGTYVSHANENSQSVTATPQQKDDALKTIGAETVKQAAVPDK
jgi:uncharacterized membrane protein YdbT with pleckstrin-like domain